MYLIMINFIRNNKMNVEKINQLDLTLNLSTLEKFEYESIIMHKVEISNGYENLIERNYIINENCIYYIKIENFDEFMIYFGN